MICKNKVDKHKKNLSTLVFLYFNDFTLVQPKIMADRTQQVKHFQQVP